MKNVTILDTTLRDGELTEGVTFSTVDKITIASQLAAMGVDVVEVAVLGASRHAIDDVRAIAATVRTCTLCVLTPSSRDAIDAAGEALAGAAAARIHVFQPMASAPRRWFVTRGGSRATSSSRP
jgi:2-isopropylmalate synthase